MVPEIIGGISQFKTQEFTSNSPKKFSLGCYKARNEFPDAVWIGSTTYFGDAFKGRPGSLRQCSFFFEESFRTLSVLSGSGPM